MSTCCVESLTAIMVNINSLLLQISTLFTPAAATMLHLALCSMPCLETGKSMFAFIADPDQLRIRCPCFSIFGSNTFALC